VGQGDDRWIVKEREDGSNVNGARTRPPPLATEPAEQGSLFVTRTSYRRTKSVGEDSCTGVP